MANNLLKPNEDILVAKGVGSNGGGVMVVDPNRVINKEGLVDDRYINQEDLVMYANLKAYIKPTNSIFEKQDESRNVVDLGAIKLNFLNPIKNIQTDSKTGKVLSISNKNELTVDYTDFFTSKNVSDNMPDPEGFGITSIDVIQNASMIPKVVIEFTDVQGRTLLERGNDPNSPYSPYNLFYRFPYPTFLLTLKGYYGKAIEYPLVLLKSNTKFDPNTGNYTIRAEFLSRTFAIFNTFLITYAYVAPFMFKTKDGDYIGERILADIYRLQNKYYADLCSKDKSLKFSDYEIKVGEKTPATPAPIRLFDLRNIIDNLSVDESKSDPTTIKNTKILDNLSAAKTLIIDSKDKLILGTPGYTQSNLLSIINSAINNNLEASVITKIREKIKTTKIVYNDSTTFITQTNDILQIIDDEYYKVSEQVINSKIVNITQKLGYKPTIGNIYRIIMNNIQTFLILLDVAGLKASDQISFNTNNRVSSQKMAGEYDVAANGIKNFYPFPNYFMEDKLNANTFKKIYPGNNVINKTWSEVEFIDEVYKAIDDIHQRSISQPTPDFVPKESGLISPFFVGDGVNLFPSKNQTQPNEFDIIGEMFSAFQHNFIYSGLIFRNKLGSNLKKICEAYGNYEFGLLSDIVLDTEDVGKKYTLLTFIKNILSKDTDVHKSISTYLKGGVTNNFANFQSRLKASIEKEKQLIGNNYTTSDLTNLIAERNKLISDNMSISYRNLLNSLSNQKPAVMYNRSEPITPMFTYTNYAKNHNKYQAKASNFNFLGFFNENFDKTKINYFAGSNTNLDVLLSSSPLDFYNLNKKVTDNGNSFNTLTFTVDDANENYNKILGLKPGNIPTDSINNDKHRTLVR